MKIIPTSITQQAEMGRMSIQVPDIELASAIAKGHKWKDRVEMPDDWFMWLSGWKISTPANGCLFLSRKGWEANQDKIKVAFLKSQSGPCGDNHSWEEFVSEIDEHFEQIEKCKQREIKRLKKRLSVLENS